MNQKIKDLEEELEELYQEYDSLYEGSREVMMHIEAAESELEKLKLSEG
tara:strand:+ start:357 stop:503 length:147 start_codon:yes stop_codon:yes gene_type:complete